jgi:hypothetical protein
MDSAAAMLLQCPLCSHPPYTYKKALDNHLTSKHAGTEHNVKEILAERQAAQPKMKELALLSSRAFRTEVTEIAYPAEKEKEKETNKRNNKEHGKGRRKFKKRLKA